MMFSYLFLITAFLYTSSSEQECTRDNASNQLSDYASTNLKEEIITLSSGIPVDDIFNSKTVGPGGPLILEDTTFLQKFSKFDRERIPERIVHAKGTGAAGFFEVTNDEIKKYSKALVFSEVGKKTPILVRLSTFSGEQGSADTVRDLRGFAIKFYTEDGNWDLLGLGFPIFSLRDPLKFISFAHSQKKNPVTNLMDADMSWDFFTLNEETTHHVLHLYSDLGTPDGFRHMNGYAINIFKLVNEEGYPIYCRFSYLTDQGTRNLTDEIAKKLMSEDPEYATRDLYNAIAMKRYPSWTLYFQVMTFKEADEYDGNPFDVTKEWPKDKFPLKVIGKIVLTKNPTNFFAEVEQLAFAPSNMVPGIEPSSDKILQGRMFPYIDTHAHRLGRNFEQIPVNSPKVKVTNLDRDGMATYTDNQGGAPNYFPSSFANRKPSSWAEQSQYMVHGVAKRYESIEDSFTQPRMFWNKLSSGDKRNLVSNMVGSLKNAKKFIQERAVELYHKVDPELGLSLAKGLDNAWQYCQ